MYYHNMKVIYFAISTKIYIYISQTNLYSHKNDSEKKTLHLMQQIFILQLYTCT